MLSMYIVFELIIKVLPYDLVFTAVFDCFTPVRFFFNLSPIYGETSPSNKYYCYHGFA